MDLLVTPSLEVFILWSLIFIQHRQLDTTQEEFVVSRFLPAFVPVFTSADPLLVILFLCVETICLCPLQASIWLSWCFDQKTRPACGVWRPSTPCVRWSNPGFALVYSALHHLTFAPLCFCFLPLFSHHLLSTLAPLCLSNALRP